MMAEDTYRTGPFGPTDLKFGSCLKARHQQLLDNLSSSTFKNISQLHKKKISHREEKSHFLKKWRRREYPVKYLVSLSQLAKNTVCFI